MRKKWVTVIVAIVSVPLSLFLVLVLLFLVMLLMRTPFILPRDIENDSTRAIEVIPVGRLETTGSAVGIPPLYLSRVPIPRGGSPFTVAPGETTTIFYDFDDINLCWLLVRADGVWKVQPTTMEQTGPCALDQNARGKPCCGGLEDEVQHVQPLETLVDAPPWLTCVADHSCP